MGLNEGGGQKTYLKISDGKIAMRCNADDPKAIKCSNKEGTKEWFEKRFPSVNGFIRGVYIRQTDYGPDLSIQIEDGRDSFELQMKLDSKYATGFLKCMPNLDLTREVYFKPWMKEVVQDGKTVKKTALYLTYDLKGDEKIEWFWTKDKPLGLPDMVQVMVKGKLQWDNTDQMNFLVDHLENTFKKRLENLFKAEMASSADLGHDVAKEFQPDPNELNPDDAPF